MRYIFLIAALLAGAFAAHAQDITVMPNLREGDTFQVELTRTRQNTTRPQQNGESRTVVTVQVISSSPDGTLLDWAPGETEFDNPLMAGDPLIANASEAIRGIHFRLMLNAEGELTGLANEDEVVPKLQSVVDTLVQELSGNVPAEQRQAFKNLIDQVLSPAALISSATREAEIYFSLSGVELTAGESVDADIQVPNPFGGGPLTAQFRVELKSVTPDSAMLATTTVYDAEMLREMTLRLLQQTGRPPSPEEVASLPSMILSDDGQYRYDRELGLMREVIVNRRVSVAPMSRHDGWRIRLLTEPVR